VTTKRTLRRPLAEAEAQNRRLADARQDARDDAGTEHFNVRRLAQQLDAAREENAKLRAAAGRAAAAPAPAVWRRERSQLKRELDLARRASAALDARVRELGAANDALSREAYDRALGVTPR